MSEEAEGTGEPIVQLVNRDEQIVDPKMSIIDIIGDMARICYRTEPKEGEDVRALNERVIKHCIKNGHESVLEHGAISVAISQNETPDSRTVAELMGVKEEDKVVNFMSVWTSIETEAQRKYSEVFVDPSLYARTHEVKEGDDLRMVRAIIADVRAWRQIIREHMFVSMQTDYPEYLVVTLGVLKHLYDVAPVLFEDIVTSLEADFNDPQFHERIAGSKVFKLVIEPTIDKITDTGWTIANAVKFFFKDPNTIFAAESDPGSRVSMILTTERATTHQQVRHRKNVAYSQESQRYVNYDKKGCRVIPLTMEPAKFKQWCKDHNTSIDEIFSDYDLGRVREDSLGGYYFGPWYAAMIREFRDYKGLLNLDLPNDLPQMKPETARGALPNDTATRIGITWLLPGSFMNYVYWRLAKDDHAQYSIRASLARILVKMFNMKHPFLEAIPFKTRIRWFTAIQEQEIFSDPNITGDIIRALNEQEAKIIETMRKIASAKQAEAQKKEAEQKPATDGTPGVKIG